MEEKSFDKLLPEESSKVLHKLLEVELTSAYIYEALANIASDKGFHILSCFMIKQRDEEKCHYDKVREYLLNRNCMPKVKVSFEDIESKVSEINSYRDILVLSIAHEKKVEEYWTQAKMKFKEYKDISSGAFSYKFILEQIEEIAKFSDFLAAYDSDMYNGRIIVDNMLKD